MTQIKQVRKTKKDIQATLSEESEQLVDKKVSEEVELILKQNDRALQPFVQYTEAGVVARVRLVRTGAQPGVDIE